MRLITLILATIITFSANATERCKGTTKSGAPCKSTFVSKDGYCNGHNPSKKHCPYVKPDKTTCNMKTDGSLCRFHKQ